MKTNIPTPSKMKEKLEDFAQQNPQQFIKIAQQMGMPVTGGRYMPSIIQDDGNSRFSMDPFSYMLKQRSVFYTGSVDEQTAELAKVQLLYLEAQNPSQDIYLYIDSPGGDVHRGNGLIDTMNFILPDVTTIVCGMAMSMGAMTLVNGAPGKRYATLNSRIMIHQPLSGAQGQATSNAISAKETNDLKIILLRNIAQKAGVSFAECVLDCERDNFMSPREALEFGEFGLIDGIIVDRRIKDPEAETKDVELVIARRGDPILDELYPDDSDDQAIVDLLLQKGNGTIELAKIAENERVKREKRMAQEAKAKAEAEAKAREEAQKQDDSDNPDGSE